MKKLHFSGLLTLGAVSALLSLTAWADVGDEVEVNSAPVSALSCALDAKATGKLDKLSNCPMPEAVNGYVVFDVAEKQIYRIAPKKIRFFELEKAYGGGSLDFSGVVVGEENGYPVVELKEYSVTARPKPGAFKGCL